MLPMETKKMKEGKSTARITDDVIWEILLKLPPEFILQCRMVCKSWLKMIQNPLFIRAQVEKTARINTIDDDDNRLILVPGSITLYNVVFPWPEKNLLNVARVKELEHPGGKKRVNLVGTCNGLICLENEVHGFINIGYPSYTRYFTLWNPSTGIRRMVPDKSSISLGGFRINTNCYFGYDHVKDDYHVIRVTRPSIDTHDGFIIIHLYSLKNNSWTKIHNKDSWTKIHRWWAINKEKCVYISGTLYILSQHQKKIIAFDISTRSFRRLVVELPPPLNDDDDIGLSYTLVLGELHGRLSIMEEGSDIHNLKTKHVIWLMMNDDVDDNGRGTKETLWKTMEIETSEPVYISKVLTVGAAAAEEEQLLLLGRTELCHNAMIWYNLKTKSTTHISLQSPLKNIHKSEACVCLTTIASPFLSL